MCWLTHMLVSVGSSFAQAVLDGPLAVALLVSALAGFVSFASPCVLPLIPGYIGYVTGLSGESLRSQRSLRVLGGVSLFILGFAIVFVLFGVAFSAFGLFLREWSDLIMRVLGVVVIAAGIVFLGGFKFLQRGSTPLAKPRAGLVGAPILGATFALSWAPCMGPTLAAVLALSTGFGAQGSILRGSVLAFAYCVGLGVPFLLGAFLIHKGMGRLRWLRANQVPLMRLGGAMLVILGLLLVSGLWMAWINSLQGTISEFDVVI